MRHAFKVLIVFMFLGAFFYGASFIFIKNTLSANVSDVISWPVVFLKNILNAGNLAQENYEIKIQNESLKAQLFTLKGSMPAPVRSGRYTYQQALVHSSYPFNTRKDITINRGSDDGMVVGMPVIAGEQVLLGRLTEVLPQYSVVRTVFDTQWELPVRIGIDGAQGLFVGGQTPEITMVDKEAVLISGSMVYSTSKDFPYGFVFGEINTITEAQSDFFKRATVAVPYNINDLKEVFVITNY